MLHLFCYFFFFFNDTATTEIYTLSLHDALPICSITIFLPNNLPPCPCRRASIRSEEHTSELQSPYVISYAVFCLKKKQLAHPGQSSHQGVHESETYTCVALG